MRQRIALDTFRVGDQTEIFHAPTDIHFARRWHARSHGGAGGSSIADELSLVRQIRQDG
jgi:hypothetical protein